MLFEEFEVAASGKPLQRSEEGRASAPCEVLKGGQEGIGAIQDRFEGKIGLRNFAIQRVI